MKGKGIRLWVHPDFRKKMKKKAADKDMTVLKLTQMMAHEETHFHDWRKVKPKKSEKEKDRERRKWFTI